MKKDYIARLTIPAFPKTKAQHKKLVEWLRQTAKNINKESDYKIYAPNARWTLMK